MQVIRAGHTGDVYALGRIEGRVVISGGHDKSLCLWDYPKKTLRKRIDQAHDHIIKCLATCCYNGRSYLISGSWDRMVRVWDIDSGLKLMHTLVGHTNRVKTVVAYVDEGGACPLVVSAGDDGAIRTWDLLSGQSLRCEEAAHMHFVVSMCLTASGILVSSSSDKTIKLWDLVTGEGRGVLETGDDFASCLHHAVVPLACEEVSGGGSQTASDGSQATTGGSNQLERLCCGMATGQIRIYDSSSLEPIHVLAGHQSRVTGMCLSTSSVSGVLFTVSQDGHLRSWSLLEGQPGYINVHIGPGLAQTRHPPPQTTSQRQGTSAPKDTSASTSSGSSSSSKGQGQCTHDKNTHLEVFGLCSMHVCSGVPATSQENGNRRGPTDSSASSALAHADYSLNTEDLWFCCSASRLVVCEVATINTPSGGRGSIVENVDPVDVQSPVDMGESLLLLPPSVSISSSSRQPASSTHAVIPAESARRSEDHDLGLSVAPLKLPSVRAGNGGIAYSSSSSSSSSSSQKEKRVIVMAPSVRAKMAAPEFVAQVGVIDYDSTAASSMTAGDKLAVGVSQPNATHSQQQQQQQQQQEKQQQQQQQRRQQQRKQQPRRTATAAQNEVPAYCVVARAESGVVEEMAQAALLLHAALGGNSSSRLGANALAKAMRRLQK